MLAPEDRHETGGAPLRVLVAVHGYEAGGWGAETARVLTLWNEPIVRVLGILDVPCPPLTSVTPRARRAYVAARAAWSREDETRVRAALGTLVPHLPPTVEVRRVPAVEGDLVRTVIEHAQEWGADIVVVGPPLRGFRAWVWPGPVHERLLRRLPCAVLVTPPPPLDVPRPVRRVPHLRAVLAYRRG